MTASSELGGRLRRARLFADLEQAQMAAALGVNRSTISAYERGVGEPGLLKVALWAQLTNRSIDWFVWGDAGQPALSLTPEVFLRLQRARRDSNPQPSDLYSHPLVAVRGMRGALAVAA